MTPLYTGVNGANREVNRMFTGVNGANREVTRLLTAHNGVNRDVLMPPPLHFINNQSFLPNHPDGAWSGIYTHYGSGAMYNHGWYFGRTNTDFMSEYQGYISANTYNISKYKRVKIRFKNMSNINLSNDGYAVHFSVMVHTTVPNIGSTTESASFDIGSDGHRPFGQEYTVDIPIENFKLPGGSIFNLDRLLHVSLMMHHPVANAEMYVTEFTLY